MSERATHPTRRSIIRGVSAMIAELFIRGEACAASQKERVEQIIKGVDSLLLGLDTSDASMRTLIAQTSQPSRASLALRKNVERYAKEVLARNSAQRALLQEVKQLKLSGNDVALYAKAVEVDERILRDRAFLRAYREKAGVDRFNLIVGNTMRV